MAVVPGADSFTPNAMNAMEKTIDVESTPEQPPTQAMTVRDAVQAVDRALPPEQITKPQVTAAQAKIEAVANLTAKAYERASELALTPEEVKALQADFPDEAFKPGAAGKENLIYIEHAFLRDRLNAVIGPGQWALIPRSRWAEDFTTSKGAPASRVYVEAMLLVRGCFVAEAVGEMEYWKNNASQNYGDAVEGAKTAALRRCCKEFGIGLQAWKKDWCEGWWARKRQGNRPPPPTQQPQAQSRQQVPPPPPSAPQATGEQVYPVVSVIAVKEVHSPSTAKKPWIAYFVAFNDGVANLEAATFSKSIADTANEFANSNRQARLVTKPGNKPGKFEIVSLDEPDPAPPQEDNVPMDDEQQNPQDLIP